MDSSHIGTPSKHEKGDDESDVDLTIFYSGDDKSSDLDDYCHHLKKVSTCIQLFSIFIASFIITN
jgi:hypothetical protein